MKKTVSHSVIAGFILISQSLVSAPLEGSRPERAGSGQSASEVEQYWTIDRMNSAEPMPMGKVHPEAQKEDREPSEPVETETEEPVADGE